MTTASPNQFDHLAAVDELHVAVRKWTEHIPQNLPYVDLMFAFCFANLGDRARAESLVEASRKLMEVPIPEPGRYWTDENQARPFVVAIASSFLLKAFRHRIDQALAGKPHIGPLPDDLLRELEELGTKARTEPPLNDYKIACYIIGRMREQFRIIEPSERIDTYAEWTKSTDLLRSALTELTAVRESAELGGRIRRLLNEGLPRLDADIVQFMVLQEALSLAPRLGEAFAVELLELVPGVVLRVALLKPFIQYRRGA